MMIQRGNLSASERAARRLRSERPTQVTERMLRATVQSLRVEGYDVSLDEARRVADNFFGEQKEEAAH